MIDFTASLLNKIDLIVDKWAMAVSQDPLIESAQNLPYKDLLDNLPIVLRAMATLFSKFAENDIHELVAASLNHGTIRGEQGYDAAEIAREYRLARETIFAVLEEELLKASPLEVIRVSRIIDTVIDEAIARCFKSYTEHRLNELQQIQSQLQLTNQELNRLLQDTQQTFSQLTENLQIPIKVIKNYSDHFLHEHSQVRDNVLSLENIDQISRNSIHLLQLLNDALEFSRYETGKIKLQLSPTNIHCLLANVIEIMEPFARAKGLQLIFECEQFNTEDSSSYNPLYAIIDPLRLQQVLTNLISNALYSTEQGYVKVVYQLLAHQEWYIAISDSSKGMTLEEQKYVFEPNFGLIDNQQHSVGLTGLGMALVVRLVKLLQGKIELFSQVGLGSTFTVTFPLEVRISAPYTAESPNLI